MKRMLKKIISMLSIITLMQIYIIPIYSRAQSLYYTYLALGGGVAYGYGLDNRDTESYVAQVKKYYDIADSNFKNLTKERMKCADFYEEIQTKEYKDAIENADLITVSIGSDEVFEIVMSAVSNVTGISQGDENFYEEVQNKISNLSTSEQKKMFEHIYTELTSSNTTIKIESSIENYETNWTKSVQYIKKLNPDAIIVATQFYNPYYDVALGSYDFSGFIDAYVQRLNEILTDVSNNEAEYKIAKIYDSFNRTGTRLTNVNVSTSNFSINPYPNKLGHEIIYTKIVDVLSEVKNVKRNISALTINDIEDQDYTGKKIEPKITIKDGDTVLVEGEDYTVSYTNQIDVGQAKVIITGIGNYKGTVTKTFNIKSQDRKDIQKLTISSVDDQTYLGVKITPDVVIKDGYTSLTKDVDYKLIYSNNINVGDAQILIEGIGNYSGEKTITFKIIPKDVSYVTVKSIPDQKYTGESIKPEIELTDGSIKMVENTDYTVEYSNNIEIGQATIIITGKGNYTGTLESKFNIIANTEENKININTVEISEIKDKTYTGKLITPEIDITNENKALIKNTDYTISYKNNLNVGVATVIIEGIGDYTGKVEKEFNIIQKDIKYTTIEDISDQTYTGNKIEPKVIITSDSIKLEEGKDYEISYSNNIEIGTATVTIEGIGNYNGTMTKTFNIKENAKENEEEENKANKENKVDNTTNDETVSTNPLPFTGNHGIILIILGICVYFISKGIIYNKRFKDVK